MPRTVAADPSDAHGRSRARRRRPARPATTRSPATRSRHGGHAAEVRLERARSRAGRPRRPLGREQRFEVPALSSWSVTSHPPSDVAVGSFTPIAARAADAAPRLAPAARNSIRRPREIRDITVPIGTSSDAGDLGVRELLDVAQPDRLAKRVGQRVERRLQVDVERRPRQQLLRRPLVAGLVRGLLHGFAVDVDRDSGRRAGACSGTCCGGS